MDTTIVSALAGIFGSLAGGLASVATAWVAHKTLNKREAMRMFRSNIFANGFATGASIRSRHSAKRADGN
jgi:hypothetical protein